MQRLMPSKEEQTQTPEMGKGPCYPQDGMAALPAHPTRMFFKLPSAFQVISNTHFISARIIKLLRSLGNLNKKSEIIKRFAASGRGKCYPSPGVDAEGVENQCQASGTCWIYTECQGGWGPGLQKDTTAKQHIWTIFNKDTGIQRVLPPQ